MNHAVDCDLFCKQMTRFLFINTKTLKEIKKALNNFFSNFGDSFVNNKPSILFGDDKTKSMLFGTKHKLNKIGSLDIKCGTINFKQYHTVTYCGWSMDENLCRESMALKVLIKLKINLDFF